MKIGRPLIILGLFILGGGMIFHLQGQSVLGPESSFMYANPNWISYGLGIAIFGIIIIGVGVVMTTSKKSN